MDNNKETSRSAQETILEIPRSVGKENIPKQIGRYQILSELGRGGMGIVFKAQDSKLQRIVALKVLIGNILTQERKERFFVEARSMAQLDHNSIIRVYDFGEDEEKHVCYFTMDYIEGQALDTLLKQKPLSAKKSAMLVHKICAAMSYCHSRKIIHRDLKPSNIMLKNGQPFVMDFGIAKMESDDGKLTKSGAIIGSPHYMSPEQAEGDRRKIDHRTDIYSLGMILYHCLTGKPSFADDSVMQILLKIMREEPVPPRQVNPRIPEDLEKICLKALNKDRDKRYQTMNAFARDLEKFMRGEKLNIRQAKKAPTTTNKWWWVAGAVVIAFAAMFFGGQSEVEALRYKAEEYLHQGFSQKAVVVAEEILHKKITNEDAWQIWFSGNYQLLSKNYYEDVQQRMDNMGKNIPHSLDVEAQAIRHVLDANKYIEERALRKARKTIAKLRNNNSYFIEESLQKTVGNLEQKINETNKQIEKEEREKQREEQLAQKQREELLAQKQREEQERREREMQKEEPPAIVERILKERPVRKILRNVIERPRIEEQEKPQKEIEQQQFALTAQMFRGNIYRNGHVNAPDVLNPTVKKRIFLERIPLASAPIIVGGDMYVHNKIALYKIDMRSWKIRWVFSKLHREFKPPHLIPPRHGTLPAERRGLVWDRDILYIACDLPHRSGTSTLCAIHTRGKARLLDSMEIPGEITSPLIHKGRVYFGCSDGSLRVVELKNDKLVAARKYPAHKKSFVSSPVILGDRVYFKNAKSLYGYSLNSEQKRRQRIGKLNWTTPVVYDDLIFIANAAGEIGCVDHNLDTQWFRSEKHGQIHSSLGVHRNHVYIFYTDGKFHVYDRLKRKNVGFGYIGPTSCPPVFTENFMYIGNNVSEEGAILHIFDLNNLIEEEQRIKIFYELSGIEGDILAEPLLYAGKIILVTTAGWLYIAEGKN